MNRVAKFPSDMVYEEVESQKHVADASLPRRNAQTSGRVNDVEIEERLVARTFRTRSGFLQAHLRGLWMAL